MPDFKVDCVKITNVSPAPNADRMDLIKVYDGYPCLVKKSQFKVGDLAAYIVVDSMVPTSRPEFEFLRHSREKALAEQNLLTEENSLVRIKAMKLRGTFSMGLLVEAPQGAKEGDDLKEHFGIKKYEEQVRGNNKADWKIRSGLSNYSEFESGPNIRYYDLEHLRKYYSEIGEDTEVYISEKLHGSLGCFFHDGKRLWVKSRTKYRRRHKDTFPTLKRFVAKSVKFFLGEKFGSWALHKLKIKSWLKMGTVEQPNNSIWWETAIKYDLENKLKNIPNLAIFGEIFGEGIQDLTYGCKELTFRAFDILNLKTNEFLDYDEFIIVCRDNDIPVVPFIYRGPNLFFEEYEKMAEGNSLFCPSQIKEGIVVKTVKEKWSPRCGRVALKVVGQGYLLRKDGTEHH